MNQTQLKTILVPIVAMIAGWLATKFPLLDPVTWNTLVTAVVTAIVAGVLGVLTKNTALTDTVGKMEGTKVVAPAAVANALPANPDVVSSTENKVVAK